MEAQHEVYSDDQTNSQMESPKIASEDGAEMRSQQSGEELPI